MQHYDPELTPVSEDWLVLVKTSESFLSRPTTTAYTTCQYSRHRRAL